MLPDPQTVTINAVAIPLARTGQGNGTSEYSSADGLSVLSIFNTKTKGSRERHVVRWTGAKNVADQFTAGNPLKRQSYTITFSIDNPEVGFSDVELRDAWVGIRTWLSTSIIDRVLANEA